MSGSTIATAKCEHEIGGPGNWHACNAKAVWLLEDYRCGYLRLTYCDRHAEIGAKDNKTWVGERRFGLRWTSLLPTIAEIGSDLKAGKITKQKAVELSTTRRDLGLCDYCQTLAHDGDCKEVYP